MVLLACFAGSVWDHAAGPAVAFAQTGLAGTWRVERPLATWTATWTAVFRVDGPRLVGAVSSCSTNLNDAVEIHEGTIDDAAINFNCTSGDGDRTIMFTGRHNADEIAFEWDLVVRDGGFPRAFDVMFGVNAPRRFVAKRVPDAKDAVAEMAGRARRAPAVSFDRILRADQEPQNWLTYSGTVLGHRHSRLTQVTPSNVKDLELAWIWQSQSRGRFEATALVVDGILYTVQAPNDVVALDAVTGRVIWAYTHTPDGRARASGGGGRPNRGLAILGGTLFMGTLDAHLLAIDAYTGKLIWNSTVANALDPVCQGDMCYVITHAPLVVKDKVIVGVGGGDGPIRGFIAAFDVVTGKEIWRFHTIPAPGEPGSETWAGDSWRTGGVGVWTTGAYDPDLNLTYWGTGNPAPARNGSTRLGDNLYSDSVVALDVDTGKVKWYYQFTPHDDQDWDSAQVPVLTDLEWQGRLRKVILWANRNGLMYVLDRTTGEFVLGKPFVEVNWMNGFDGKGRPVRVRNDRAGPAAKPVRPGCCATNWYSPSYSPNTGLFYFPLLEDAASSKGYGAIGAFDPRTGERTWEFRMNGAVFSAGVLTTASDLLFTGVEGNSSPAAPGVDGYFYALDARTGQLLWRMSLAGSVHGGPMSYSVRGKQYIAVAAGNTLFTFALRQ
jgi:alcohol dehydrogenase (cytochrome c)